ncbi:MAG: hypothetical protein K2G90_04695, partial [Muribaculaceae bacterium]|nr:hypothetical protein [Muribaculaceae bacterium]
CVPLEVKSGVTGKMKSLRVFLNKKNLKVGIRASLENFGKLTIKETSDSNGCKIEIERTIGILPLYAIWNIPNLPLP